MKVLILIILGLLPIQPTPQPNTYTIVFLNKKSNTETLPKADLDKIMAGHLNNIKRLAQEKKLLAAGPFQGGGGIFILNTPRLEEARQWIATDPGIQANRWNVEVLPYTPRYGSICPVGETYEMTSYTLVRFDALVTKFTAQDFPEIIAQHDAYLKNTNRHRQRHNRSHIRHPRRRHHHHPRRRATRSHRSRPRRPAGTPQYPNPYPLDRQRLLLRKRIIDLTPHIRPSRQRSLPRQFAFKILFIMSIFHQSCLV